MKKIISVILSVCLLIGIMPIGVFAEAAQNIEIWDGITISQPLTGAGTEEDPYLISNGAELAWAVTNGGSSYRYYQLTNDIYLNDVSKINWDTGVAQTGYTPNSWYEDWYIKNRIDGGVDFQGSINGNGCAVYGLYYDSKPTSYTIYHIGSALIPKVLEGSNATVKNLGIDYAYINVDTTAAAFVGVTPSETTVNIDRCYAGANVVLTGGCAATFRGYARQANGGSVTNCYSLATTVAMDSEYFGLFGMIWDNKDSLIVRNCFNANGPIAMNENADFWLDSTNNYESLQGGLTEGVVLLDDTAKMQGADVFTNASKMPNLNEDDAYLATDGYPMLKAPKEEVKPEGPMSEDGYIYTVENGEATITGTTESLYGEVIIPDTLGGYPVTKIGNSAFSFGTEITRLVLSNNITVIEDWAFDHCSKIKEIRLPENLTHLGSSAFAYCYEIEDVYVPVSLSYIGMSSFELGEKLANVYYEGNREQFAEMFIDANNTWLLGATWYYLGEATDTQKSGYYTYEIIGDKATIIDVAEEIEGNITIPSMLGGYPVDVIGERAFENCFAVNSVIIPDSVTTIDRYAFYENYNIEEIIISDSVETIGDFAFADCFALNKVTIGNSVKSIGRYVFSSDSNLTNIAIPDSVETIGEQAFGDCSRLAEVTIGSGVTSIGDRAFIRCGVKQIIIPDSVTFIGESVFSQCDVLESVNIGNNITNIPRDAFYQNAALQSIVIPDSVTSIEISAFSGCLSLNEATIGAGVKTIGEMAFYDCVSLQTVYLPYSIKSIDISAFSFCPITDVYYGGKDTDKSKINIESSNEALLDATWHFLGEHVHRVWVSGIETTNDANYPFAIDDDVYVSANKGDNTSSFFKIVARAYTDIEISYRVSSEYHWDNFVITQNGIEIEKISGETDWKNLSLTVCEGDVIYLEYRKDSSNFAGDDAAYFTVSAPEKELVLISEINASCDEELICDTCGVLIKEAMSHTFDDDLDIDCNNCGYIRATSSQGPDSELIYTYTIDNEEVTITGVSATLSGNLVIPDTIEGYPVTAIGRDAFMMQNNLTSVVIPDTVIDIGEGAFYWCENLVDVHFGNNVRTIGSSAFCECYNLSTVVLPDSVTNIESCAFDVCVNLGAVYIGDNVQYIGKAAFDNCYSLTAIEVSEYNQNYSSQDGVLFNKDKTVLIQYTTGHPRQTYVMPNSVVTIEDSAFACSESLEEITLGNNVKTIGNSVFFGSGITSVTIPESVEKIGYAAFMHCTSLANINVTSGNRHFSSVNGVLFNINETTLVQYPIGNTRTSYTIPNGVVKIDKNAFDWAVNLTKIIIINGVENIEDSAFAGCTGLESVTVPDSVTNMGDYVFSNCSNLKEVVIGNGLTELKAWSFAWCNNIETVTLGDNILMLREHAFYDCSSLESIIIGSKVAFIEEYAFNRDDALTDVYFKGSKEQKDSIFIDRYNDPIKNATWHYNYIGECDHVYDNACDTDCNNCGENRETSHAYTDIYDATCNICGAKRDVPTKPTVPGDVPSFSVNGATLKAGETFTAEIKVNNNPGICALEVCVGYDASALELVSVVGGAFAGTGFGPTTANPFKMTWVSALAENTTNGTVATLTFKVKEDAPLGATEIVLSYDPNNVYDFDFNNVYFETVNAHVEVIEYILGDVNDDGVINNKDVGELMRFVNGWENLICEGASDVNMDGKINNRDIGYIQRYINGFYPGGFEEIFENNQSGGAEENPEDNPGDNNQSGGGSSGGDDNDDDELSGDIGAGDIDGLW